MTSSILLSTCLFHHKAGILSTFTFVCTNTTPPAGLAAAERLLDVLQLQGQGTTEDGPSSSASVGHDSVAQVGFLLKNFKQVHSAVYLEHFQHHHDHHLTCDCDAGADVDAL